MNSSKELITAFVKLNQLWESSSSSFSEAISAFQQLLLQYLWDDCSLNPSEDYEPEQLTDYRKIWQLVLAKQLFEDSAQVRSLWAKPHLSNKEQFYLQLAIESLRTVIRDYASWCKQSWLSELTTSVQSLQPIQEDLQLNVRTVPRTGTDELRQQKQNVLQSIWNALASAELTADAVEETVIRSLRDYAKLCGSGVFAEYSSARWKWELQAVENPPAKRLQQFVGYEFVRSQLLQNTLSFLKGTRAQNVLLYGDRGTGKSSTIHAIVNEYWDKRLRLIDVGRENYESIPELFSSLGKLPYYFIILFDDLSFESHESEYKKLKTVLEGGAQTLPHNVLLYATSNRRHFIQETFADKNDVSGDDIRRYDTLQEKLSLADRFGLVLSFYSPDKNEYLEIVYGLARQQGLTIDDDFTQRALRFEREHAGRSPRIAEQFIRSEMTA